MRKLIVLACLVACSAAAGQRKPKTTVVRAEQIKVDVVRIQPDGNVEVCAQGKCHTYLDKDVHKYVDTVAKERWLDAEGF